MDFSDASTDFPTDASSGNEDATKGNRASKSNRASRSGAVSTLSSPDDRGDSGHQLDFSNAAVRSGREEQERTLREAYQRVSSKRVSAVSEVVLIHGISGTGKSSLVETIRETVIVNDLGFFVSGKFDQLITRKLPFSAIAAAFSDVCDLILQSEQLDEERRTSFSKALDASDIIILSSVVSNIAAVRNGNDASNDISEPSTSPVGSDMFTPFKLACQKFLRAVAAVDHPLVLFLDDLQWADEMSIQLINFFINDKASRNVLFCLAYRDNDFEGKTVLELDDTTYSSSSNTSSHPRLPVKDIQLMNLDEKELSSMLAPLLHVDRNLICTFASLVLERTKGNPHAVVQLLLHLKRKGLLTLCHKTQSWKWSIRAIESEVSDNLTEIIAEKVGRLLPGEQEALRMAAFLGNSFDASLLLFVLSVETQTEAKQQDVVHGDADTPIAYNNLTDSNAVHCLQNSVNDGLLIKNNETGGYTFAHDSIQHYLYSSSGSDYEQEQRHLQIGRRVALLAQAYTSGIRREALVLLAANNVVRGTNHIVDEGERLTTLRLLLDAATLAQSKGFLGDAGNYLDCAVKMMRESDWGLNCALCIDLQNTYAEVLYCTGRFEESEKAVQKVLKVATITKDRFRAQCTKIRSLICRKNNEDTLDWVFNVVLKELGVSIPIHPSHAQVLRELASVKFALWNMAPEAFLAMPEMVDERIIATMKVFSIVVPVVFSLRSKALYLCCTLREIQLSKKYGISPFTSVSLIAYAIILQKMNKMNEAYELGEVAVELSTRESHGVLSARSTCLASNSIFISYQRSSIRDLLKPSLEGYMFGLRCGSTPSIAFFALFGYLSLRNELGFPIGELEDQLRRHCGKMREFQATQIFSYLSIAWQYHLNLLGRSDNPLILTGEAMHEEQLQASLEQSSDSMGLQILHSYRLRLQMSFEAWASITRTLPLAIKGLGRLMTFESLFCSVDVIMASLAMYEETRRRKHRRIARKFTKKMRRWVKQQVPDVLPLMTLIDAECKAIIGKDATLDDFEKAITALKASGFTAYEMLAYQRAVHLVLRWPELRKAGEFLMRSVERHREWGNVAKVEWLESMYSGIHTHITPAYVVEVSMPPSFGEKSYDQ